MSILQLPATYKPTTSDLEALEAKVKGIRRTQKEINQKINAILGGKQVLVVDGGPDIVGQYVAQMYEAIKQKFEDNPPEWIKDLFTRDQNSGEYLARYVLGNSEHDYTTLMDFQPSALNGISFVLVTGSQADITEPGQATDFTGKNTGENSVYKDNYGTLFDQLYTLRGQISVFGICAAHQAANLQFGTGVVTKLDAARRGFFPYGIISEPEESDHFGHFAHKLAVRQNNYSADGSVGQPHSRANRIVGRPAEADKMTIIGLHNGIVTMSGLKDPEGNRYYWFTTQAHPELNTHRLVYETLTCRYAPECLNLQGHFELKMILGNLPK